MEDGVAWVDLRVALGVLPVCRSGCVVCVDLNVLCGWI